MIENSAWAGRAGLINDAQGPLYADALAASGEERTAIYTELGQLMIDDLVIMPLVNPKLVLATQADMTGMHYSGCCNLDLSMLGIG